jgi:hypothetical protein
MTLPIAEQIAVKVRTRLLEISTANSYAVTASQVIRPKRIEEFRPRDYTLVINQPTLTRNTELSCPGNPPATAWDMKFLIYGINRQSETSTTSMATLGNVFWADTVKALTDAVAWHNWDGLAINSDISEVNEIENPEGTDTGFELTLTVTFRVDETNPYNVRG